jgi:hypothetical protein
MTDLVDEVKSSFEKSRDEVSSDEGGSIALVQGDVGGLAPGFIAMRSYYEERLLSIMRRGYRHFAGSSMPTSSDVLLELTSKFLQAPMIAVSMGAFTDGVMIGHRSDQQVKMCFHFNSVEHLFHDDTFRDSALRMTAGFAEDSAVCEYFNEYVGGALAHIAHVTGFAHSEVVPAKVWDVWLLAGTACITASYLAGTKMGTSWRERDVLDGIEMASESEREDGPDQ